MTSNVGDDEAASEGQSAMKEELNRKVTLLINDQTSSQWNAEYDITLA